MNLNNSLNSNSDLYWFGCIILILLMVILYLIYLNRRANKEHVSLTQSEEILKTIINSLPHIICYKDGNGRWIEANEAIIKLFTILRSLKLFCLITLMYFSSFS